MKVLSPSDAKLLERFAHGVGRGINRFSMIGPGDKVLIGVSGGKDSLALAAALRERMRWVPVRYELFAVQVEWREYPLEAAEREALDSYFDGLSIPLHRVQASIHPPSFRAKFSCYTCARNRKRLLFGEAERVGATRIALGHHMDDIARTTLMNLFFHGEFSTMMPVQEFFGGKLRVIRPLCEVREAEVAKVARRLELPTVSSRCPNARSNHRGLMAEMLRQAAKVNRHAVSNVYGAAWRINRAYLPAGEAGAAGEGGETGQAGHEGEAAP
jgi:tRNA 2-thiocytidine biosynthesis protein TtcA